MKFEHLREFLTAAESKEMQQAAEVLKLSPSALSKHMKALEKELGAPLFKRARHIELTQPGQVLLRYARQLVALQDEYLSEFSRTGRESVGSLVIGLSPIQFRERSGQILEQYMLTDTAAEVRIREAGNSELCGLVRSGECDLVFTRTQPELTRDTDLVYMPFCADEMVAFLPPDHPLSAEESITISQLRGEKILLRSEKSAIHRVFTAECEKAGFEPDIAFAGSFAVYDLVRRGEGITLYLAPPSSPGYGRPLAIVPIRPAIVSFVDIVFKRNSLSAAARDFLQYVQEYVLKENLMKNEQA